MAQGSSISMGRIYIPTPTLQQKKVVKGAGSEFKDNLFYVEGFSEVEEQ